MRLAHVMRARLWCLRISRCSARIAYCGLFALSLSISWILREFAAPLMEKLPCKLPSQIFSMLFTFVPGKDKTTRRRMQSVDDVAERDGLN